MVALMSTMLFFQLIMQSTGTSAHFDPRRFILFPVSLRKLFFLNLASALGEVVMIMLLPSVAGVTIGLGVALHYPLAGVLAFLCALVWIDALFVLVGVLVAWQLSGQKRRTEVIVTILMGLLVVGSQLIPRLMETEAGRAAWRLLPHYWRDASDIFAWTPIGVWSYFFAHLQANDVTQAFARLLVVCIVWTGVTWAGGYAIFKRVATSARASSSSVAADRASDGPIRSNLLALKLPLVSGQISALLAKEIAYLIRNTAIYLNVVSVLVLTLIALRPMGQAIGERSHRGTGDWADGISVAIWVSYAFLLNLQQFVNVFGLDAAGFRQYLLSPLVWRRLLLAKNLAIWLLMIVQIALIMVGAQLLYQELTPGKLYIAACATLFGMGFVTTVGNYLSINFPFRLEFGVRTRRSGERFSATTMIAGVGLLASTSLLMALPFGLSYLFRSAAVKYLAFFVLAMVSGAIYLLWLGYQSHRLEARRFEIAEALTRRTEKV
jgi:threonine/homoserine/homoserine lactone efflux protein